ncbi:trans-sialidase, putative, partial [Trypanosoma cruzi]
DLFVPQTTLVLPKKGTTPEKKLDSFVSPSLVSAGGIIAAFAEGHVKAQDTADAQLDRPSSDVVAGYIDSAWNWTTLVDKVNQSSWRAHTVLAAAGGKKLSDDARHPTTIAKGNKVFLLVESPGLSPVNDNSFSDRLDLTLVVGTVTNSTGGEPSKRISWENPKLLLSMNISAASYERELKSVFPSGGSGVLMDNGALVFPVVTFGDNDGFSMII